MGESVKKGMVSEVMAMLARRRARSLSPARRREIARAAARARWSRRGGKP